MAGNQQHRAQKHDFKDPFNAGQMVGMLMIVSMLEEGSIDAEVLKSIKWTAAENASTYLEIPAEDIILQSKEMLEGVT